MIRVFLILSLVLGSSFAAIAQQDRAKDAQPDGIIAVGDKAAPDQAIKQRITDILSQLDAYDQVRADVDAGIVTLEGTALDRAAVTRLDSIIARIDGVVDIQNNVAENTELRARLEPVVDRFGHRIWQTIAFLPLLAVSLIAAVLIGFLGSWIARRRQPWDRLAPNPFIADILRQVIRLVFWVAATVVALDILGATALLGTFLGAAGIIGIAIGFAVRDTVENFIASVMLSLRQPFRPNDLVEIEGNTGRVIRLTSRATTLLSPDGNHIRIPNSTVFKALITNYTKNPERRFQFDLGIDANENLAEVRELGLSTLRGIDFVLTTPAPSVFIEQVGDSNVVMRFSGWVAQTGTDFNLARGEAIRILKETIEAQGYGLPEPIYRLKLEHLGDQALQKPETIADTPKKPAPVTEAVADVRPDRAIDRMVEKDKDLGEPNLLSEDAPQE